LNFGVDVGGILGIYFFGDSSTVSKTQTHEPVILVLEGMIQSLHSSGLRFHEIDPTHYSAESMIKAITPIVEQGKIVETSSLYSEGRYYEFGLSVGEIVSTTLLTGEESKAFLVWR